jgi:SAM-dependent methyltransferase
MNQAETYRRQLAWRSWPEILDRLPGLNGQTVLDLGCAIGDQAAELAARGARVVGFDCSEELLSAARSRRLANVEFRQADLRALPELGCIADGIWCSFAAAYFPRLGVALSAWKAKLKPGGWIALVEIDDLFGHEPLSAATKDMLRAYVAAGLAAERYDFFMGRKLRGFLEAAGFESIREFVVPDAEFSFRGAASPDVANAWRNRLDWMRLLHQHCGEHWTDVRAELIDCLIRPDHRATARVICCLAQNRGSTESELRVG